MQVCNDIKKYVMWKILNDDSVRTLTHRVVSND